MTETSGSGPSPDPGTYEVRVRGHLDGRWAAWFDGLELTHDDDGTTVVRGRVADQAALHGLLHRLRDLGLPLVSVMQVDPSINPSIKGERHDNDATRRHQGA
jgi:hypothetical protein